ncbi:hypothetical protein AAG906_016451 [Vitis piasezkii]
MRSNGCNWFLGSLVYNDSYPFYDASKCPFIRNGFNCLKNGRPDKEYLKYKWKPNDCDLPRDSLRENQWQSLTCMVHAAIPQTHFNTSIKGDLYTIAWPDYEISIILCHKKSGTCNGETKPIKGSRYPTGLPPEVGVVKEVLSKISKPVTLLDITTLSQLRKDGHPSIYSGSKQSDCSHWCLIGILDTWNELLYAFVVT